MPSPHYSHPSQTHTQTNNVYASYFVYSLRLRQCCISSNRHARISSLIQTTNMAMAASSSSASSSPSAPTSLSKKVVYDVDVESTQQNTSSGQQTAIHAPKWNRAIPESGYIRLGSIRYGVKMTVTENGICKPLHSDSIRMASAAAVCTKQLKKERDTLRPTISDTNTFDDEDDVDGNNDDDADEDCCCLTTSSASCNNNNNTNNHNHHINKNRHQQRLTSVAYMPAKKSSKFGMWVIIIIRSHRTQAMRFGCGCTNVRKQKVRLSLDISFLGVNDLKFSTLCLHLSFASLSVIAEPA